MKGQTNEVVDPNARIADLVGLLHVMDTVFQGKVDLFELEKEMEVDLDDLMPIVYTASALGLVTAEAGNLYLTPAGSDFIHAGMRRRKEIIREAIRNLEPFATALSMREFELPALMDELQKKGVQTYNSPTGLHDLEVLLIEWGIYSGLLRKKTARFRTVG
ncbi:MAG: AAA-associated domain-containing protein [Methanomassiliicoccales archaeon]